MKVRSTSESESENVSGRIPNVPTNLARQVRVDPSIESADPAGPDDGVKIRG